MIVIFTAFRLENEFDLFDPSICCDRWLKERMDFQSQRDYVLDETTNAEIIITPSQTRQTRQKTTYNQKFRKVKLQCEELIVELPKQIFDVQFQKLKEFTNNIKGLVNHGI